MAVLIDRLRCTGCADCIFACPINCLGLDGEAIAILADAERCFDCQECYHACPELAIAMAPYRDPIEAGYQGQE